MQPQELIRAAAEVIRNGGWSQGTAGGVLVHARDHAGEAVSLYGGVSGDSSRAAVNGAAVAFSIYGAMCKVIGSAGSGIANPGLMWHTMYRMADLAHGIPLGGTNHANPIIGYNEAEGRTVEEVLAFLESCAVEIETPAEASA